MHQCFVSRETEENMGTGYLIENLLALLRSEIIPTLSVRKYSGKE